MTEVWTVLAAARDLDDVPTQLIARRIVEMHLAGRMPREADVIVIRAYFD
ncbi:hypothetical protein ACVSQB_33010 [Bradyrhizobium elkanii]